MLFHVLDLFIWEIDILMYQTCVLKWFLNLPLFYLFTLLFTYIYVMSCLAISLCMFTNNAPPKLVHSFASDPSGGGVLHLVSEHMVREGTKKAFRKLLENYFQNQV